MPQVILLKRTRDISVQFPHAVGFFAFNSKGERCSPLDPDACQFDALGALRRAASETQTPEKVYKEVLAALDRYAEESGFESLAQMNDQLPPNAIHRALLRVSEIYAWRVAQDGSGVVVYPAFDVGSS